MAARYQKARERISLTSKKERNYENNTRNKMDLDKAGDEKYSLQL